MTDEDLREYAIELIKEHAVQIEWLTIFERGEDLNDGEGVSDEEAEAIWRYICKAKIKVKIKD